MEQLIDIQRLAKMPITDEFAKMLFGDWCKSTLVKSSNDSTGVIYVCKMNNTHYTNVLISTKGHIMKQGNNIEVVSNAFQIVRYIDNYLRLNNHNESVKSIVQSAFNLLKINKND